MEREEHVPDQFEIKQVPPYSFAEKEAIIGRIHEFYFVSIGSDGAWKYQLFKDEMKCREFCYIIRHYGSANCVLVQQYRVA